MKRFTSCTFEQWLWWTIHFILVPGSCRKWDMFS